METKIPEKYCVLQFTKEHNVSVVPTAWILNETTCRWPRFNKNLRTQIMKRVEPATDWREYQCIIIGKFDTYEEALLFEKESVASSCSESEETGEKIKRRIKSSKKYEEEFASSVLPEPPNFTDSENEDALEMTTEALPSPIPSSEKGDETITEAVILTSNDIQSINENINALRHVCDDLSENILEIKSMVNIILMRINSLDLKGIGSANIDEDLIAGLFPINSVEDLLRTDEILKSNIDISNQLFNKLMLVGGSDYKNLTRRCLPTIFNDQLAMLCSWTGQKNNLKVGDTAVMAILRKAVKKIFHTTTDKEFESVVMDWLRFAKQRLKK